MDSDTSQNVVTRIAATGRADAWAVGSATYPHKGEENDSTGFAGHWDGHAWTRVNPPAAKRTSQFADVAATSAGDAWIAGTESTGDQGTSAGIVEHWDGHRWSRVYTIRGVGRDNAGAAFTAVTAPGPRDVWAAGRLSHATVRDEKGATSITPTGDTPVLAHWDGTRWSRVDAGRLTADRHLAFVSLAASNPSDVWAAGLRYLRDPGDANYAAPLLAHWDGRAWSAVTTPRAPGGSAQLSSVTAASASDVWAAGSYQDANGFAQHPLAEHWDGRTWTIITYPGGTGKGKGQFAAAAADGRGGVWALVQGGDDNGRGQVVHWDGHRWTTAAIATPGFTNVSLNTVAAIPGTGAVLAGGGASLAGKPAETPGVPLFATNLRG